MPERSKIMDYKDRMKKEYTELKDRHAKLHKMLVKYEAGKLDFKPDCPIGLLHRQKSAMDEYLECLEIRAEYEDIELE